MPISVCPACGEEISLPEGRPDRPARCPHCDRPIAASGGDRGRAPGPPPLPRRSRRRKLRALLVVGLVAAATLFACAGGGTLFYFFFFHDIDEPVTAADKEVLATAEYVVTFVDDVMVDPNKGTFQKARHLDGSRDLTYEYGTEEDSDEPVHISHAVTVERNAKEARDAYAGMRLAGRLGVGKVEGIQEVERNDLWTWGDQFRCAVLHNSKGLPVGNVFMGLKGRRYFILVVSGVYFDKPEAVKAFLDPLLRKLDGWDG